MHRSCPMRKQTALSSYLVSEKTSDAGKHSKTSAEKDDQMILKGSNDAVGGIDTSGRKAKQDERATTKHKTRVRTSHQHEKREATRLMTQLDDACPKQGLATAVRPPETCWCTQSAAVAVATAPITDLLLDGEFTGGVKNRHRP